LSNKYCNLVGSQKIRDEYTKINTGFDSVEADIVQSNTETANHFAGTGNRHTTAHITNGSGVIGETAEAALDTLKGQYENMVTGGASNTAIGVFSVVASGTDTISGTYSGLSALFGGLKVNLQIADTNTGAATFNLNSLGAKSIKKVTALGIKMPLNGAEMTKGGICQLQYDGTDWILIGAKLPYYATPKEATSSIINLGSDAKGTFVATVYGQTKMNIAQDTWATSLDGWTASGNVQSIVSNKYRLTNTSGAYGLRPLSLDLTKYYLIQSTVYLIQIQMAQKWLLLMLTLVMLI
jgi:hypothetical protein